MPNTDAFKQAERIAFRKKLKEFAESLKDEITIDDEWSIKGFIDSYKNIYTISSDTKIISKILEIHLFPKFLAFAEEHGFILELATCQNWYPDITLISKTNKNIKFAVDLKTTYRDEDNPDFCNGFTLGSHGEYFTNRDSTKNIQYPYSQYIAHFCLGIIYSRNTSIEGELKVYALKDLQQIKAVIKNFIFFAEEKWRIASDKGGSGNTANIGSINKIEDIINGNGMFARAGEEYFDDYWSNFGKLEILKNNNRKKLSSFKDYLEYRSLPSSLYNPKAPKIKIRNKNDKT